MTSFFKWLFFKWLVFNIRITYLLKMFYLYEVLAMENNSYKITIF